MFPFSLSGRAKQWFYKEWEVVNMWDKCSTTFLAKFFPMGKTNKLRGWISNFQQSSMEIIPEAWERLQDYIQACSDKYLKLLRNYQGYFLVAWLHISYCLHQNLVSLSWRGRDRPMMSKAKGLLIKGYLRARQEILFNIFKRDMTSRCISGWKKQGHVSNKEASSVRTLHKESWNPCIYISFCYLVVFV